MKEKQGKVWKRKGGGIVTTESETGVKWPQAKESLEPSEAGRGEEQTFP